MKKYILVATMAGLIHASSGQGKDLQSELLQLRYLSAIPVAAEKIQTEPDLILRALVARQAFNIHDRYQSDIFRTRSYVYPMVYYGLLSLLADSVYQVNRDFGLDKATVIGDSVLNQYHGHKPDLRKKDLEKLVAVRSVSYADNGGRMFSAGGDGRLMAWDVDSRRPEEIYRSDVVDRVVNVSSDGRWLALATNQDEIDLFDLTKRGSVPRRITSHKGAIYDLAFVPDNTAFVSVGADREILLTDLVSGDVEEIALVSSKVQSLAVSPDGKTLAAGSARGEVFLYDLKREAVSEVQKEIVLRNHAQLPVRDLDFSASGRFLAIGGFNLNNSFGYVVIWDMVKKEKFGPTLRGFTAPVLHVDFSPDDDLIAASSNDKTARVWRMGPDDIYNLPIVLDDHKDWVWDLDFSPDGKYLMTASADGLLRRFPLNEAVLANRLCGYLHRNLSQEEWKEYFGNLPWEETCSGKGSPTGR